MSNSTPSLEELKKLKDPGLQATKERINREKARRHFKDFINYTFDGYIWNWHLEILAKALEDVVFGRIKRLMVFLPPRHGKSEQVSVRLPPWFLGMYPNKHVIAASYSGDLAVTFGAQARDLVREIQFQNLFPKSSLNPDSEAKNKWNTIQGGSYTAAGVGGSITGKGADLFIIDDPFGSRQEADSKLIRDTRFDWYRAVAYTRLSPDGAIVVINTRWHDNDLAGRLLEMQDEEHADKWTVLSFPALATENELFRKVGEPLWPQRYSMSRLLAIKTNIGTREWSAQYQQTPIDDAYSEFKIKWFKYITEEEMRRKSTLRFLTVDSAVTKKDDAAFTGFVDNRVDYENFWHIKAWRKRVDAAELLENLFSLHQLNHYTQIGVEETLFTKALEPFYNQEQRKRNLFLPLVYLKTHNQSKEDRIRTRGLIPRYSSGAVFHIKNETTDLEEELIRFPVSTYRDLSDALSYQTDIAFAPGNPIEQKIQDEEDQKVEDEFGLFPEL